MMVGKPACKHRRVKPVPCDQTLGIQCLACRELLAYCWGDEHLSEELWNRACLEDPNGVRCESNRDDVCGICGEPMKDDAEQIASVGHRDPDESMT